MPVSDDTTFAAPSRMPEDETIALIQIMGKELKNLESTTQTHVKHKLWVRIAEDLSACGFKKRPVAAVRDRWKYLKRRDKQVKEARAEAEETEMLKEIFSRLSPEAIKMFEDDPTSSSPVKCVNKPLPIPREISDAEPKASIIDASPGFSNPPRPLNVRQNRKSTKDDYRRSTAREMNELSKIVRDMTSSIARQNKFNVIMFLFKNGMMPKDEAKTKAMALLNEPQDSSAMNINRTDSPDYESLTDCSFYSSDSDESST